MRQTWATWCTAVIVSLNSSAAVSAQPQFKFNQPAGVDIWCGKSYRAGNATFNPGGQFLFPAPSEKPLLQLLVKSRWSINLATEKSAGLLISTGISHLVGQALPPRLTEEAAEAGDIPVTVDINLDGKKVQTATVPLGVTNFEVTIADLGAFIKPSMKPYTVTVQGKLQGDGTVYTANSTLSWLPYPDNYGSVSRIDHLYGGLWTQRGKNTEWQAIFVYTFYAQWTLYWNQSVDTLDRFTKMGFNAIHPVPTGDLGTCARCVWPPYLQRADELGLHVQWDVNWRPDNTTDMIDQVTWLRTSRSLLLWYQSDEADGKGNDPASVGKAYDTIRSLDPYHPSSLALNCKDFHYADFAKGGDIVVSDVYPFGNNVTFSTVYHTPCTDVYGCCGCDGCDGRFEDISARIDSFQARDDLIGWSKSHWVAPQTFGNESFWSRYPTAAEVVINTLIAVNHGALGVNMWDYPATAEIVDLTRRFATLLTGPVIADFWLKSPRFEQLPVTGADRIDAAAWYSKDRKQLLLSVLNLNYGDLRGPIDITLPAGIQPAGIADVLWGSAKFQMSRTTGSQKYDVSKAGVKIKKTSVKGQQTQQQQQQQTTNFVVRAPRGLLGLQATLFVVNLS